MVALSLVRRPRSSPGESDRGRRNERLKSHVHGAIDVTRYGSLHIWLLIFKWRGQ
jgi:hypothetical protein